ncbi:macrophage mannose receptor 1-like isoform X2 [Galleria mellonella]|uniref:Macrophage mannose receptor 1-like isoform X2 n=1 Tax=Galleria mellonella TaxID=7137 RepID=A0A6J3CBA6_GALME|nr:macrophage mannose receptor 1-like isoform X2 [Galleria mellonella]
MFPITILHVLLLIEIILHCSYGQRDKKFFRKDYKYLEDTESFYKIHTISKSWQDARKTCKLEGASLFYPVDEAESNSVIKMWTSEQAFEQVFIGISSLLVKGAFITIDGVSISDIYHKWSKGEPNNANGNEDCVVMRRNNGAFNDYNCAAKQRFICKKTLASLEWNSACNMPDTGYTYSETFGRCYKFHLTPKNWTEAYATCNAEQSFLAIIESQAEADYFVKLTQEAPKDLVRGNYLRGAVLLGFHNVDEEGTALEDVGYSKWGNQQPDGGDSEKCGSMFYNGKLNDLGCHHKCFFICECDNLIDVTFDERFATL